MAFLIFQVWNIQAAASFDLKISAGLVYSMAVNEDLLFAGCQVIGWCHPHIIRFLYFIIFFICSVYP